MKLGIATKIGALAFALILVTAGSVGVMVYESSNAVLVRQELDNLGWDARLAGVRLVSGIEALRQDVLFLSQTPAFQGILRAQTANMRRTTLRLLLLSLFFLPLSASAALTQEKKAEEAERTGSVYRVDFAVHELEDGKRVNTRHYLMLLEAGPGRMGRVRASSRVPVSVSGGGWQFMDVGLSLDCALREHTNGLALEVTLDLSNFVPRETEGGMPPIVRQIRSSVNTVVLPGKPTVVSRVEDTATGRRYELEVTATKVN